MKAHNLILLGHKNCGKTYWGQRLAQQLQCSFIETDQIIMQLFGKQQSCSEIYKALGEDGFRKLEQEAVLTLQETLGSIVALGGGTPLAPKNVELLKQMGPLVYLKVDRQVLKERTLTHILPAFFNKTDPDSSFETHYLERTPLYEAISTHSVCLSGMEDHHILERLQEIAHGK